ncbi:DUF1648 domain-containing protein [Streptomyces sp. NPDC052052]|uniref:DUF1648 domain-containing protein n=1 Tax=Streptomyces sp. NPDC052052 TaxID=3154756 RepID=UPI00343B8B4B
MMRKNLGRATVVALPFLLALVADLVLLAVLRDRLPARLASHFEIGGRSDQYLGQAWYAVVVVLLFAGTGALWVLTAMRGMYHGQAHRRLVAGGYAFAGFLGWVMAAVLIANVDAGENARGEAQGVSLPVWQLAAALGVAVLAGGLGMLLAVLTPVPERPEAAGPAEDRVRIALADGEVAGWARSTGSRWLSLLALGLVAGGVVLLFLSNWEVAIPLLVCGALLAVFARLCVVVDRRGITVSGLLPWPRLTVPLDRIEAATSRDINPLAEYGGWGYRIGPRRSGLVIRSGEGIVATLVGGRVFAVTVDDSATGAALLNALVDRRRAGR